VVFETNRKWEVAPKPGSSTIINDYCRFHNKQQGVVRVSWHRLVEFGIRVSCPILKQNKNDNQEEQRIIIFFLLHLHFHRNNNPPCLSRFPYSPSSTIPYLILTNNFMAQIKFFRFKHNTFIALSLHYISSNFFKNLFHRPTNINDNFNIDRTSSKLQVSCPGHFPRGHNYADSISTMIRAASMGKSSILKGGGPFNINPTNYILHWFI
jgi:hypothetical protein